MSQEKDRRAREIAERARQLFSESLEGLDGRTRSRLRQARARAVESAGRRSSLKFHPAQLMPVGGIAAAVLAIMVFRPWGEPAVEPVESTVINDLDILLEGEALDLFEELEFYAWLLEQPQLLEPDADPDDNG